MTNQHGTYIYGEFHIFAYPVKWLNLPCAFEGRGRNRCTRTVARPELGLDTGALADKEGEGGVVGLDVTIVLLHELPAGDQIATPPKNFLSDIWCAR